MATTTRQLKDVPDDDHPRERTLDASTATPVSVPGATVIYCETFVRTGDEEALRYDGDVPTHVVGVYRERDARDALTETYSSGVVERAFERGERMENEHKQNATEAVAYAERRERIVTDGGEPACDECDLPLDEAHAQPAGYVRESLDGEVICGACNDRRRDYPRQEGRVSADEIVTDGGTQTAFDDSSDEVDTADTPVTTIATTPRQALSGTVIGADSMAQCSACARSIGEVSEVALRAHRLSDEARWTSAAVYCSGCVETHGTIRAPTLGAAELVLAGRLALRGDAATQEHRIVFQAESGREAVLDYSGADDGSKP